MIATFEPGRAQGCVTAPISKSEGHRILICRALSAYQNGGREGALSVCRKMLSEPFGASLKNGDETVLNDDLSVTAEALLALFQKKSINCEESASTLRFLLPAALLINGNATFTGSRRLMERGVAGYEEAFQGKVRFTKTETEIHAEGTPEIGSYPIRGDLSSQYVTGLMLAMPLMAQPNTLPVKPPVESRPYIFLTAGIMRKFGVTCRFHELENSGLQVNVQRNQIYQDCGYQPQGDWSGAANLLLLNEFSGSVRVKGISQRSIQGDRRFPLFIRELNKEQPVLDVSDNPDLAPTLFVAAAVKNGATFTGIRRLRNKESDRVAAMRKGLLAFGIETEESENELAVKAVTKLRKPSETLDGCQDHRIVMALSALLTVTGGSISSAESVSKSYPDYFRDLEKLGIMVKITDF